MNDLDKKLYEEAKRDDKKPLPSRKGNKQRVTKDSKKPLRS